MLEWQTCHDLIALVHSHSILASLCKVLLDLDFLPSALKLALLTCIVACQHQRQGCLLIPPGMGQGKVEQESRHDGMTQKGRTLAFDGGPTVASHPFHLSISVERSASSDSARSLAPTDVARDPPGAEARGCARLTNWGPRKKSSEKQGQSQV